MLSDSANKVFSDVVEKWQPYTTVRLKAMSSWWSKKKQIFYCIHSVIEGNAFTKRIENNINKSRIVRKKSQRHDKYIGSKDHIYNNEEEDHDRSF